MKLLKQVRLINWHRFENETIPFSRSTLVSGENGAGKSTILDAIQFAVTCSKANFNKAAQEKGRRTLNSYIRCKTGREDHPYEREGALSAHICLEFFDEARKKPFLLGVVMDTASEDREPACAWYLMEDRNLSDDLFLKGEGQVKSISQFRSSNRGIRQFCLTQAEAKRMILARFGRLENQFFNLIPKALAFRPISDIKDFVYSYVLDRKEVNIEALQENVRSFQNLGRMLEDVRIRIRQLEEITEKEQETVRCLRLHQMHSYYISRAQLEVTRQIISDLNNKTHQLEMEAESVRRQAGENARSLDKKNGTIRNLQRELDSNEDYIAVTEARRQADQLRQALQEDAEQVKYLRKDADKALEQGRELLRLEGEVSLLKEYCSSLKNITDLSSLLDLHMLIGRVKEYKGKRFREIQAEQADLRVEIRGYMERKKDLEGRIRRLQGKQLIYKPAVLELKRAIEEEMAAAGRDGQVRILCELLEVTDPDWQNAVEGYMNTQRFYLLTEPEDFDLAVSTYDRLRGRGKVYGVGLINSGRLEAYEDTPRGSLAEHVTSKNVWARRYINMILGRVTCCDSYQDLKNYPVSITRECMRYQNHVVSAIHPSVFKTPYIGAGAYKVQLQQAQQEKAEVDRQLDLCRKKEAGLHRYDACLETTADVDLQYRLDWLDKERSHKAQLQTVQAELERLEASRTLLEKEIRIQQLEEEAKDLEEQGRSLDRRIGKIEAEAEQIKAQIGEQQRQEKEREEDFSAMRERSGPEADSFDLSYEKAVKGADLARFIENRISARKANWTLKEKAEEEMRERMRVYRIEHDFGAADTMEGYPEYEAEYDNLKNSRLLEYEEKVYRARQAAEEEFREQFLSKLQENIRQAQSQFRELNRALSGIHFSHERYEFIYEPRRPLKKFYDMIMDDFNVMQGSSLFSGAFNANHKEVIEELFEKLTLDDESAARTLEAYTDYRTYMDYDIRILLDDGSYMLYSKVSREKSGGETQTPFYITVAASFMQLYRSSIGGDSVGLIMMDEAFNNMDDERIAGVLEFMNHTNLQTIIAAPPDKIQYIGPAMDSVLLVLTDREMSYVEDFSRETEDHEAV